VLPQVLLNTTAGEDLRSVLTTFGNRWEGEKPPEQKSDDDPWRQIFNSGTKVDKSDAASGAGRYTIPVAEQVNDLILNNPDLFAQRERAEAANRKWRGPTAVSYNRLSVTVPYTQCSETKSAL